MKLTPAVIDNCRAQFPALAHQHDGRRAVFLDGPAGTQVPQRVIDAIQHYLVTHNANHGGLFATSRESDHLLDKVQQAAADFLGAADPDCVSFGANMTTLTFAVSRALARTWRPGDEILLTRLEHDANFTPWILAAEDAGATIRIADVHVEDCTLNLDDLYSKLSERTRLVAVGCASNAVGTVNPVAEICQAARKVGALSFLDAVHYAPHALIDVESWGCDLLACSAYKFFGPHIGLLYGRRQLLEEVRPYKLRTSPEELPGRWMTGTQNHECLAGVLAAIDYLADLGRLLAEDKRLARRPALKECYQAITKYEQHLMARLLAGLAELPDVKIYGICDPNRRHERLPTVSITHARLKPDELAQRLGDEGLYVWHGNYYALPLTEVLGVEPDGMVRIGLVHYNTVEEVDRLLETLAQLA